MMSDQEVKGLLEKQLQLLSEQSQKHGGNVSELVELTRAMNETASYLLSRLSSVI